MNEDQAPSYVDVVIVGAGLSGIGAAYHLQDKCPDKTYTILEARGAMGGTWDLFQYPGVRSDSDMYTLGFSFYPWKDPKAIANGPAILAYIQETAATFGIDQHIQYHHRVVHAAWSSTDQRWTLSISQPDQAPHREITCSFLFMCCGYYDYKQGHFPDFEGLNDFEGKVIHPQHWDVSLSYANQRVVVVGSGATAVTLAPEIGKQARKVYMLQRTPTYIMNLPREDAIANGLKRLLPSQLAHTLARWKNILRSMLLYQLSKWRPNFVRRLIQKGAATALGEHYREQDFDPPYNPWDQRLCLIPDNDLFDAIKTGTVEMVTDTIHGFDSQGIRLNSGRMLEADLVVMATGLKLQLFGGMTASKDGVPIDFAQEHAYKGVMISGVPNFAVAVGYTNASWTLKCDLNCLFVMRVLNHMRKQGYSVCMPSYAPSLTEPEDLIDLSSGYIQRGKHLLPKQGPRAPWRIHQNYLRDLATLKYQSVRDEYLTYR